MAIAGQNMYIFNQQNTTPILINTVVFIDYQKIPTSKCENYRGITLLPTAYKLFTNIIKNRLNEHLEDEMVEEQCGFRKGRSCTDAMFTVQQII